MLKLSHLHFPLKLNPSSACLLIMTWLSFGYFFRKSSGNTVLFAGLKPGSNRTSANRQADEVGEERLVVKDLETLPCKLNGTHTRCVLWESEYCITEKFELQVVCAT